MASNLPDVLEIKHRILEYYKVLLLKQLQSLLSPPHLVKGEDELDSILQDSVELALPLNRYLG